MKAGPRLAWLWTRVSLRAAGALGAALLAGSLVLFSGPSLADDDDDAEISLDLVCIPEGASTISLLTTLRRAGEAPGTAPQDLPLELIVNKIKLEVHSESGGFWIQLKQPVLPRMTFEICEILGEAGIAAMDLDAGRFFLEGETIGAEDSQDVEGRCQNFPPPSCPVSE